MASRLLLTGSAGYIGGSLLQQLVDSDMPLFQRKNLIAVVRSVEQAQALSKLGVEVLRLDLDDSAAVSQVVQDREVDVVVHTASSLEPVLATNLIRALGKRARSHNVKTYFLHTSGSSAFYESTGWPAESRDDTETVFKVEKEHAASFPIRGVDVAVVDCAREEGVTSFIVVPCVVYGKGYGQWNRQSVVLPIMIKSFVAEGAVYRFPNDTTTNAVHISDMVAVYQRILQRIVQGDAVDSGPRGYYFAFAHDISWKEVAVGLNKALLARGLLKDPEVRYWPSDEFAAKALGVSVPFLHPLWNSRSNIITTIQEKIGWVPGQRGEFFSVDLEREVESVLTDPVVKSSLVKALKGADSA